MSKSSKPAENALAFYQALFEEMDPQTLMRRFLNLLLDMQNVERGSIWERTERGYICREAAGSLSGKVKGVTIPLDTPSVAGWVIEHGEMTVAEAGKDNRHYAELESDLAVKSSLILCFPLILDQGQIYGALQIIDTTSQGDRMNLEPEYLALLQTMVGVASIALSHSLNFRRQADENQALKAALKKAQAEGEQMVGASPIYLAALDRAANYAKTDFPVLITGESGTGKELVARRIHQLSPRAGGPFLVQNCSAIPENLLESELFGYKKGAFSGADRDKEGLFVAADGGTVFLDEIGDMPAPLQAKILRVIQNQEVKPLGCNQVVKVNLRFVSATNRDLPQAIADKEFREDLYYRLNVLPLSMPSLKERTGDVPLLAGYFLARECKRLGIAPLRLGEEAGQALAAHNWPGNIRELENLVKYLVATAAGQEIDLADLPPNLAGVRACGQEPGGEAALVLADYTWEELERVYVLHLLEKNRWNVTKAATQAAVNRSTFDSRLKKMGIRKTD